MMPWREQLRLLWLPVRWVLWLPGVPLWENIVMKIAQAVGLIGALVGSGWIIAAGVVLAVLLAFAGP
jgi:hypothetical protein